VHFSLGKLVAPRLMLVHGSRHAFSSRRPLAGVGGTMELRMRLNVLAAIVSFGFLAAIVLGMV